MSERDIVERLREKCVGPPNAQVPFPHRVLNEAAAEILRLRAELAKWQSRAEAAANAVPPQPDEVTWALAEVGRVGWIAGRDAAADLIAKNEDDVAAPSAAMFLATLIRNMEPPA